MSMCISTARARTNSAPRGSQALGLEHFHCKFSHKRALVQILLNSAPRGLCLILYRSLTEDLVGILVRCRVLQVLARKLLWEALERFLYQALVRSAPAAAGPFMIFYEDLVRFSSGSGMKISPKVFYNFLCEDLWVSYRNAVRVLCMILYRSLWEAFEQVLVKSFRCPYMIW